MAEEVKQEAKGQAASKMMRTVLMSLAGVAFLVLGGYFIFRGWGYVVYLVKGTIGMFCLLVGVIFLAMAKE